MGATHCAAPIAAGRCTNRRTRPPRIRDKGEGEEMSGVKIDVRSNIDQVTATIRALPDRLKERAIVRSINRAVDAVATESSREIRKIYNLKHSAVLKALTKKKATKVTLTGDVTFKGRRVPLIEFGATWKQG